MPVITSRDFSAAGYVKLILKRVIVYIYVIVESLISRSCPYI